MRKAFVFVTLLALAGVALAGMELSSARLYKKQGEWFKSYQFYMQAVQKEPENQDAVYERGELYEQIAADPSKAGLAKQIVGDKPNPQLELYNMMLADFKAAQVVHKKGDESKIKSLKKKIDGILTESWTKFYFEAVQEDSAYAKASAEKVETPDPKEHAKKALAQLDLAIKFIPERWNAYGLRAQILGKLDDRAGALEAWSQALAKIDSSDMPKKDAEGYKTAVSIIRGNLLENYYNLERYKDAIRVSDEILAKDSTSEDAIQFKAFSLARMAADTSLTVAQTDSMKSVAIKALDKAKLARPDDPTIVYYIGQFHLQLGDTAAAIKSFEDYLVKDEKDKEVRFVLGVLYLEGGRFTDTAKASEEFKKLTEFYPEDSASWINYGVAKIRLGKTEEGKKYVDKGKELAGGKQ
jgi:tetratricopeptide (TPR) repeat protein